jgi:hypothetical protein
MRHRWIIGTLAVGTLAIACSLATNLDSLGPDGGSVSCGSGSVCRPAIPAGWVGPVTVRDGPEDQGCTAPFGVKALGTLQDGIDAGPGSCTCECKATIGACRYRVDIFDGGDCLGTPLVADASSITACVGNGVVPTFSVKYYDGGVGAAEAGCVPTTTRVGFPITSNAHHVCVGAFSAGGCASGSCMPSGTKACIAAEGDLACPDPFTQKQVFHRNWVDGITCAGCTCGSFDPNSCKSPPSIKITNAPCGSDAATVVATYTAVNGCITGTAQSGTGAINQPPNACNVAAAPARDGAVTATDPVTVCCQP